MRARVLFALFTIASFVAFGAPLRAAVPDPAVFTTYTLPDLPLADVQNAVLPGSIANGRGFLLGGIGSDLWRSPADPAGEYWMVTDRGPNGELPFFTGSVTETRRTFPVPDFTPLVLHMRATNGALELLDTIPLLGTNGTPVTGLSNLDVKDEKPYNFDATVPLSYNQSGLDTEGLVRTLAGDFWLTEEYRPSVVHVGPDGRVIRRYVPAGITLPDATYPVSDTLPAIFDKRRANRGFEGLALSPDQQTVYAAVQSPLSNPTRAAGNASRNARILALDTATGLPVAEYVYVFDVAAEFDPENAARPQDMKISGVIAIDANTLLVLERTDFVAKIYKVSLNTASNILGSQWDNAATAPSLEQQTDLASVSVTPLTKTLVVNLDSLPDMPDKIEGMALTAPNTLAVINDNDFNINPTDGTSNGPGVKSKLLLVNAQISPELPNKVAAGDVTQNSATLWARASALGSVNFEYGTNASFAGAISATATVSDTLIPVKIAATGLISGTTYYYRATDAAGATASGRFRTPANVGTRKGVRFGVSGDWRGELAPYPAIANADERNLDFFVELGDTIYADYESPILPGITQTTTLEQYRLKHSEVYGARVFSSTGVLSNTWGELRSSTAILATIDDHEVTNDFAGGAPASSDPRFAAAGSALINDTPLYDSGLTAFQEYNPLQNEFYGETGDPRTAGERRLYRYRSYGSDAAVFVLDARSFRDEELDPVANPTNPAQVAAFLQAAFNPNRTMLGRQQIADLKRDLLAAQRAGVTWKFVMVPEPIQNLGVVGAPDRFEGYAAERTEILRFVKENGIGNVVFVAADIHGTLVNNLTYQLGVGQPQIASGAFEITTGSVAFSQPFGPTVVQLAVAAGLVTPAQLAFYNASDRAGKDAFLRTLIDTLIASLGYNAIGLENSEISAQITQGSYVATHVYGWTEFEIDPVTQKLTVRTYGIDAYSEAQLNDDPAAIAARTPVVVSEFVVTPTYRAYLPIVVR